MARGGKNSTVDVFRLSAPEMNGSCIRRNGMNWNGEAPAGRKRRFSVVQNIAFVVEGMCHATPPAFLCRGQGFFGGFLMLEREGGSVRGSSGQLCFG